ncbi:Tim44 domain-containing protein [Sphingomonas sp. C3-2]|uniref:Tim44 domain-containing protein n=1 Tax=Sphingomonas sp. C3-2 TaxID=3062169 RepID=UPI00294ADB86|nr:TIM44-like domain-containing protein [Sphingomonas sp. C3-2]WOK36230.1 TIM44-like domain-containing protein [Sphingomonas sp. C3-2]
MKRIKTGNLGALALALTVAVMLSAPADARRGGSFGSRGARTHSTPPATAVAPKQTAPVQRSMTENKTPAGTPQAGAANAAKPAAAAGAASKFGGMKGLVGGLLMGGLIGALLGGGLGALGGAGALMALFQILLIGGLIFFAIRFFRRKSAPAQAPSHAMAGAGAGAPFGGSAHPFQAQPNNVEPIRPQGFSGMAPVAPQTEEIGINDQDRDAFERLLSEVQDAFGREDYAALRERTTPEVMSYFAEEMSQNATSGRRNAVSGTKLLNAEVAEAWNEGHMDYATIAMHYESIDVMLDRNTGAVIEGDAHRPTDTTELWTFAREGHGPWRLSAVQAA